MCCVVFVEKKEEGTMDERDIQRKEVNWNWG